MKVTYLRDLESLDEVHIKLTYWFTLFPLSSTCIDSSSDKSDRLTTVTHIMINNEQKIDLPNAIHETTSIGSYFLFDSLDHKHSTSWLKVGWETEEIKPVEVGRKYLGKQVTKHSYITPIFTRINIFTTITSYFYISNLQVKCRDFFLVSVHNHL